MKLNFDEKVVFWYICATYILYFLGLQFITGSILGIFLVSRYFYLWHQRKTDRVPLITILWVIFSIILLVEQVYIRMDLGDSISKIVSSEIILGWCKTYGLIAMFLLAGCIRMQGRVIARAISILSIQSLVYFIFQVLLTLAIKTPIQYISPAHILGRGGDIYYGVTLNAYVEDGAWRMSWFAPWAPALGYLGCAFFFINQMEPNRKMRLFSSFISVLMVVVSVSRLGYVALPAAFLLTQLATNLNNVIVVWWLAVLSFVSGILAPKLYETYTAFKDSLNNARKGSSVLRARLNDVGLYQWQNGNIWLGNGGIEPTNPRSIFFGAPLGTHHTWIGLLFTKGLIGLITVLIPFAFTLISLLYSTVTTRSRYASLGLGIVLCLLFYSFGEAMDSLAYMSAPIFIFLGVCLKEVKLERKY